LREGGNIDTILNELKLHNRFNIVRYDPSDIIISPDYEISFWNNFKRTINELQEQFHKESGNIKKFFDFLNACKGISFVPLSRITFQDLLDKYFEDKRLKAILAFPIFGNTGFSVSKASAFTAVTVYKEFLLDGGYYPKGGMQEFPDLLSKRFEELGGTILTSKKVNKIKVLDGSVKGIIIGDENYIPAKYVVSNVDARQTFMNMLDEEIINKHFLDNLNKMTPTLSMFILYLGIEGDFSGLTKKSSSIWFLPHYDIEDMFLSAMKGDVESLDWFLLKISDDGRSILRFVNSPFRDNNYWKENKKRLTDLFVTKTEKLIPDLSKHIIFQDAASPSTLHRWTLNYQGAAYGWAGTPSQFAVSGLSRRTPIHNLYLTGHWTTLFQGIPGVAYLGRETAKSVIRKQ
jgi:phytoene dehydrogenase-like protein